MSKYVPDRKALAGGISGVLAFFIAAFTGMDESLSYQVAVGIAGVVYYFTKDSDSDVLRKVDNSVKTLADPKVQEAVKLLKKRLATKKQEKTS